jgi:hypothetical protein
MASPTKTETTPTLTSKICIVAVVWIQMLNYALWSIMSINYLIVMPFVAAYRSENMFWLFIPVFAVSAVLTAFVIFREGWE